MIEDDLRFKTNANQGASRDPWRGIGKLILYWSVALIPLAWGIIMTINTAMALF